MQKNLRVCSLSRSANGVTSQSLRGYGAGRHSFVTSSKPVTSPAVRLMAYLRCTQCGSKALVAASQCPKCAHPFNLLDARGERAKLKRCRSCGIMHRADGHCHWCGEVKGLDISRLTSLRVDSSVWRTAAAVALTVTAAGGVWRFAPQLKDAANSARAAVNTASTASEAIDTRQSDAAGTRVAGPALTPAPVAATSDSALASVATALQTSAAADGIQWTPAVARTWVNVRSDASRGGQVVGVIKPAARAMLGTDRAGWRQVRSPDISGWVDPRLFEADSLRTRGGT